MIYLGMFPAPKAKAPCGAMTSRTQTAMSSQLSDGMVNRSAGVVESKMKRHRLRPPVQVMRFLDPDPREHWCLDHTHWTMTQVLTHLGLWERVSYHRSVESARVIFLSIDDPLPQLAGPDSYTNSKMFTGWSLVAWKVRMWWSIANAVDSTLSLETKTRKSQAIRHCRVHRYRGTLDSHNHRCIQQ